MEKQPNKKTSFICILLIISTFVVYWQLKDHEFINCDDAMYVINNPQIQYDLTFKSITWAFTSFYAANWHPLTWLSHILDYRFFGLKPAGHHLINLLFHIANTILLFLILTRMTHALWRSAFVAALFALHPLHVESVAWVAERKDVLSTFFWMLTMGAYVFYVERPNMQRYVASLAFFALGLLAKPMLVTLPFVLLLLDYWPLNRFKLQETATKDHVKAPALQNPSRKKRKSKNVIAKNSPEKNKPPTSLQQYAAVLPLFKEKIPFFILSALSCIITVYAQAVVSLQALPIAFRIGNALVSYMKYIEKMLWPHNLAIFYPYQGIMLPIWQICLAAVLLLGITSLVLWKGRQFPYFGVGWFWYLGTLVPVIGLVQVGAQAMADRYTYVPLIGLFIMIAWGLPEFTKSWRHQQSILATGAGIVLLVCVFLTWMQVKYWQNSITLFEHAIQVTDNNHMAHNNLGVAFRDNGNHEEAIRHFTESLRIKPDYADAQHNLGIQLSMQGKTDEAVAHFREALRFKPDYADAHHRLGNILLSQNRPEEAIVHLSAALRNKPDNVDIYIKLGYVLAKQGRLDEAADYFNKAIHLKPDSANAHGLLGNVLYMQGKYDQAAVQWKEVLRINPEDQRAKFALGHMMSQSNAINKPSHTPIKP